MRNTRQQDDVRVTRRAEDELPPPAFRRHPLTCNWVLGSFAYNLVRIHKTLRVTPAMAANVTKRRWEMSDIVDVLEAYEAKAAN